MGLPAARLGDVTSHGGKIISGALHTLVNGLPAARMGDFHACPKDGHGVTPIVTGSPKYLTEGLPAARIGDKTACGAVIISGSSNVTA